MRIFFDTEFDEQQFLKPIQLISIGMIREDGQTYYAESQWYDWKKSSDWLRENVKPTLTGPKKSKNVIAKEIIEFAGEKPEFWAYFADYDWVVLCKLFGTMINLPKGWPMFCLDLKQEMYLRGITKQMIPETLNKQTHNALDDAKWNKEVYDWLHSASSK